MKTKIINLIIFLVIGYQSLSQNCPYLGPDQFLPCGVNSTTLTADLSQCGPGGANPNQTTNYTVSSIPYVAQTNTGTNLTMSDDSQQGPFNIGFNFCFYGQTYTQFYVGSNGWISFSGGQSVTFTSAAIPNTGATVPKNCIMGPWQDWHPGQGGQIRYQVSGVAPCRKLTVSWIGVPMFSCTGNQGTFHIVIYESTNYIENYIQNKPACLGWQNGTATQGIHNAAGTAAVTVAGRNSTAWTAQNDATRWTPSGPPVIPVLTWYQVGNPVAIGTGPTITVTPPVAGANYTCRFVYPICNSGWSACNANVGLGPDTVFVQPGPPNLPNPTVTFTNPICAGDCNGTITVIPNGGSGVQTISWNGPSGFTPTGLCSGPYNFTITDANGCTVNGNAVLTDPPLPTVGPISGTDTVCFGSTSDVFTVPDLGAGWTYQWSTIGSISSYPDPSSVEIDWSLTPSGFVPGAIDVISINPLGCSSLPVSFDLTVFDVTPIINPIGPFCSNDNCVSLTGLPIGGIFSGDGVSGTDFCPPLGNLNNLITYTYTQSGCVFTNGINVTVNPQPYINSISPSNQFYELCEGDSLNVVYNVDPTINGLTTWIVLNDTTETDNLSITWDQFGIYIIEATETVLGCVSPPIQTTINIVECPQLLIYIPNTFTPDGNEVNNLWGPVFTSGYSSDHFELLVFNRWGQIIWESRDPHAKWDGTYNNKLVLEGVYTWTIRFDLLDTDERRFMHGFITLIR
jgi:gliding motility-associated-like protein